MLFKNPQNDYIEDSASILSWLWVFLFGPIYWAVRGVWTHMVAHFFLGIATFGIAHFIYPFFTYSILRNSYYKKGWIPVDAESE
ncbi:MAG: hypothetical protein CMF31_09275 [Kordiimonas sp.]|nr:hypothetical protein [Kordiimonas sp.]|tara:strand:+ start:1363 stop:1614 length:252 start_codon:yes stop_codon:yes gene_type:complete